MLNFFLVRIEKKIGGGLCLPLKKYIQGLGFFSSIGGPQSEQVGINGFPEESVFSKVVKFT